MEMIKGVIFDHKQVTEGPAKGLYKTVVGFVLLSEKPIQNIVEGRETVILGPASRSPGNCPITETLSNSPLFLPPYPLGELGNAVISAAGFDFETYNLNPLNKLAELYQRGELKCPRK